MARRLLIGCVLAAVLLALPEAVLAQTPNQAGLVVVHGDGSVVSRCIGFTEASITGQELVARSGLDLHMEATAMGPSVCRLDGEGCSAGSNCFCQCMSSPCVYWSYWQWDGDQWTYATLGAGSTTVADGSLEGWVWGEGVVGRNAELQPPAVAFGDVCTGSNWIMDEQGVASAAGVGVEPWVLVAIVAIIPLGVGGWLLWRRRQS